VPGAIARSAWAGRARFTTRASPGMITTASSQDVQRSLPPSMRSTATAHSSPLEIVLARIGCRRRGCFDHSAQRRGPERMGLTLDILEGDSADLRRTSKPDFSSSLRATSAKTPLPKAWAITCCADWNWTTPRSSRMATMLAPTDLRLSAQRDFEGVE
jgi:hypothetical protein